MAFSDFNYPAVLQTLGLTFRPAVDLFAGVRPISLRSLLSETLDRNVSLATTAHTEASRSTWMVGPVLSEVWGWYAGQITLISGADFVGDADAGLTGVCDFLIGRAPHQPRVLAPVLVVFEAKWDSIPDGIGQCLAAMVGADRFKRREGAAVDPVYGCVTTGSLWKFFRLSGAVVTHDLREYSITQADKLLGIFAHMIGPVPGVDLAAA